MLLSAIVMLLLTIQFMTSFLHTGYRGSNRNYSGTQKNFSGCLPRNGGSLSFWLMVCSFLVKYFRQEGHVVCFISAISSTILSHAALIFVDDTDIKAGSKRKKDIRDRLQVGSRIWAGGLKVTGGNLCPIKCF